MTRITAPDVETMTLSTASLVPELIDVTTALLREGFKVYRYLDPSRATRRANWIIVSRGGNVGTVSYDRLTGYGVDFAIKTSREIGSSLMVYGQEHDDPADPATTQALVLAAGLATQDTYVNFATNGRALANEGWIHFEWARDRLVEITEHDETYACQHCGKPGGHGPGDN